MFGIELKDCEQMLEKAMLIDPNNPVYRETYFWKLSKKDPKNPELIEYAKLILSEHSSIEKQLKKKAR